MPEIPKIDGEYTLLLARLGEVWLKGRNRRIFLDRLYKNLKLSLNAALEGARVRPQYGRIFIELRDPESLLEALAVCLDTPGLSSVSPVRRVKTDPEIIRAEGIKLAETEWLGAEGSFAVNVRRSYKRFPMTSPELGRFVGDAVGELQPQLTVNLKKPDHKMGIEVGEEESHLWVQHIPAAGGLPIGSAGRISLMLSGGIDSPVAGYLAQKRGCELDAIYFHSPPFIPEDSREKVERLARRLAPRQGGLRLYVVHFTEIQKAIQDHCDHRYTVLLYRRFMYRLAAALGRRRHAKALCTGENLAQVASQTLENLSLVDQLTGMLTLRPLLTFDKQEIIQVAHQMGTYEISILPFDDCCTLFVPSNPITRGKLPQLEEQEARLNIEALVKGALKATEVVQL